MIYQEDEDSLLTEQVNQLIVESLEDFPEDDASDAAACHAAQISRAYITDKTRGGHIRYRK